MSRETSTAHQAEAGLTSNLPLSHSKVAACEKRCEEEEAALETGKVLLQQAQAQGSRMEYNLANLPDRVPGNLAKSQPIFSDQTQGTSQQSQPLKTINGIGNGTTAGQKESKVPKPKSGKSKAKIVAIIPPTIAYVKADEFESIPKYVRGR